MQAIYFDEKDVVIVQLKKKVEDITGLKTETGEILGFSG